MEVNDENNWKTILFPDGIVLQHCWLVHNSLFEQIFNQEETFVFSCPYWKKYDRNFSWRFEAVKKKYRSDSYSRSFFVNDHTCLLHTCIYILEKIVKLSEKNCRNKINET